MKNISIKTAILAALVLLLVVQTLNTGTLYSNYSHLEKDGLRFLAGAFVGIGCEFAIFICIMAGSRFAGLTFALLSFVVGILFHNEFKDLREIDFWTTRAFLSTTVMQIVNSSLVWFLSELYVKKLNEERLIQEIPVAEKHLSEVKQELATLQHEFQSKNNLLTQFKQELEGLSEKKHLLEQQIISLQKRKAGMSRVEMD